MPDLLLWPFGLLYTPDKAARGCAGLRRASHVTDITPLSSLKRTGLRSGVPVHLFLVITASRLSGGQVGRSGGASLRPEKMEKREHTGVRVRWSMKKAAL